MLDHAERFRTASPVYLALTPHVAYALSRSGIAHIIPEEYYSDEEHLQQWLTAEKDPATHLDFLEHHLFSVDDFNTYLQRSGGTDRQQELRELEHSPEN